MMLYCYLRQGVVYIPTEAKTDAGFYIAADPVAVVPASDRAGLRGALLETIARGNPRVPTPSYKSHTPILPKYAKVKNWAAFERGTLTWLVDERDGRWHIIGERRKPRVGWVEDPEQTVVVPPGTPVEDVVDRLIEILQAKASE